MSIPNELNILGYTFSVERYSLDEEEHEDGHSIARNRVMAIDDSLPHSAQVEVFYHELIHLMLDHTGLSNMLDDKQQEVFAQCLGVTLAYVVTANQLPTLRPLEEKSE